MNAAIYARKSTDQSGVSDDQKSVARQIEHATAYARSKGWTVRDEHLFVDDGISGAEFANRPGYMRLLNSLKPPVSFDALIVSELSRIGREQLETGYAVKQLSQSGVKIFSYLEDREILLDTPTDKFLMSAVNFAAEIEREKARQRMVDAMSRKARSGHVCGGTCFGYDNHEITGRDGQRSHVERRINEPAAAVVRRIFALAADGYGLTKIARQLNDEGLVAPRPQRGRPAGWAPSSVREILHRELYRGVLVWNRSQKRDKWGKKHQQDRPETDWLRVPVPDLQIIDDELWERVQARRAESRALYLRDTSGRLWGRPTRGLESKYLLPGLARCGVCGAGLHVRSRKQGTRGRKLYYGCSAYHYRGTAVCTNGLLVPMRTADDAVLATMEADVLNPAVLRRVLNKVRERVAIAGPSMEQSRENLTRELANVEREISRLTDALAQGGELASVVEALRSREGKRHDLRASLLALERRSQAGAVDFEALIVARLTDWRGLLRGHVAQGRQVLKKLVPEPFTFTPVAGRYQFAADATLSKLLGSVDSAFSVASPEGFEPSLPA